MAPKRAATTPSSSDSEGEHARKRIRSISVTSEWDEISKLKIYIVQAKIEHKDLLDLFQLIEATQSKKGKARKSVQFVLVSDYADADVIITNIRMKKRLERHLQWNVAVSIHNTISWHFPQLCCNAETKGYRHTVVVTSIH